LYGFRFGAAAIGIYGDGGVLYHCAAGGSGFVTAGFCVIVRRRHVFFGIIVRRRRQSVDEDVCIDYVDVDLGDDVLAT
jgi:hypothetical protein